MGSEQRRNTTYSAPVGCVELAAFDDEGEPYEIHACNSCLPWHAEVGVDADNGMIFIREWHAVECPEFEALINRDLCIAGRHGGGPRPKARPSGPPL